MDAQMAAGLEGAGGTEVALYAKGTELLCTNRELSTEWNSSGFHSRSITVYHIY